MSFYAYVLKNRVSNRLYKGQCEDLESRIKQHNGKATKTTRFHAGAWELAYFEAFETRVEAIAREQYFKTAAGRRFLKDKIQS